MAQALQQGLQRVAEVMLWDQGFFRPTVGYLEGLSDRRSEFDYAVLVLTPDDEVWKRGSQGRAPRDNVILELGLWLGALGRNRVFVVAPLASIALPSDLSGIKIITFSPPDRATWRAALGPVCTTIADVIGNARPEIPLDKNVDGRAWGSPENINWEGRYKVKGTSPVGQSYWGDLSIRYEAQLLMADWRVGDPARVHHGVGFAFGEFASFVFRYQSPQSEDRHGVVTYRRFGADRIVGRWTGFNAKKVGVEEGLKLWSLPEVDSA